MVRDVVCGMEIDEATAPAQSEYGGKTLYFCSEACKQEFDQRPQAYPRDVAVA